MAFIFRSRPGVGSLSSFSYVFWSARRLPIFPSYWTLSTTSIALPLSAGSMKMWACGIYVVYVVILLETLDGPAFLIGLYPAICWEYSCRLGGQNQVAFHYSILRTNPRQSMQPWPMVTWEDRHISDVISARNGGPIPASWGCHSSSFTISNYGSSCNHWWREEADGLSTISQNPWFLYLPSILRNQWIWHEHSYHRSN